MAQDCLKPLSWNWTVYTKPLGSSAVIHPVDAEFPAFTPDVLGNYTFQLNVTDGRFTSAPSYLRITVTDLHVKTPSINAVPDEALIYIDRRVTFGEEPQTELERIKRIVGALTGGKGVN